MSMAPKVVISAIAAVLVIAGAVVVYRETDLLTGSLVLLAGLMIAALLARRAAAREERAGMADWEAESRASVAASDDLFAGWSSSAPVQDEWSTPAPAPEPLPTEHGSSEGAPTGEDAPAPAGWAAPSPATDGTDHADVASGSDGSDGSDDMGITIPSAGPAPVPTADPAPSPAAEPVDLTAAAAEASEAPVEQVSAPEPWEDPDNYGRPDDQPDHDQRDGDGHGGDGDRPQPAFASAAMLGANRAAGSPIDWTGQGGRVNERVSSSEDILAASEATALTPDSVEAGGSELARLLAKVEARLRDYE